MLRTETAVQEILSSESRGAAALQVSQSQKVCRRNDVSANGAVHTSLGRSAPGDRVTLNSFWVRAEGPSHARNARSMGRAFSPPLTGGSLCLEFLGRWPRLVSVGPFGPETLKLEFQALLTICSPLCRQLTSFRPHARLPVSKSPHAVRLKVSQISALESQATGHRDLYLRL